MGEINRTEGKETKMVEIKEKEIVEHLGSLTKKRISRMRRKLHNVKYIT